MELKKKSFYSKNYSKYKIKFGFFTRFGGISKNNYYSLNCSLSSGDNKKLVKKNNLKIEHFSSQREFLLNNGIKAREEKILKVTNNKQRILIQKGVKRITDKRDMGNLFKVLVLSKWN